MFYTGTPKNLAKKGGFTLSDLKSSKFHTVTPKNLAKKGDFTLLDLKIWQKKWSFSLEHLKF